MKTDESIHYEMLQRLADRMIEAGVDGLFALGTTGEFYALTEEEKQNVVRALLEAAAGRVPVYAGAGAPTTGETLRMIRWLNGTDVAGVSVVTPYYIAPSQEELADHYCKVAECSEKDIIVYNIPARTGVTLEAETLEKIADCPRIAAVKDSSGRFEQIQAYLDRAKGLSVLAGTDSLIHRTLEAGGSGAVAATANVVPELVVEIYRSFRRGDGARAAAMQEALAPLRSLFSLGTVPSILKECVCAAGLEVGGCRMPLRRPSPENRRRIQTVVDAYYEEKIWEG